MNERLIVKQTDKPQTFLLEYDYHRDSPSSKIYSKLAREFKKEVENYGLKPMLKRKYKVCSEWYITFRSRHDAMAFKLRWL